MTAFMSLLGRKPDTTYQPSDVKDYIQLMNLHQPAAIMTFVSGQATEKHPKNVTKIMVMKSGATPRRYKWQGKPLGFGSENPLQDRPERPPRKRGVQNKSPFGHLPSRTPEPEKSKARSFSERAIGLPPRLSIDFSPSKLIMRKLRIL